jgi:hypothetical protein
MTTEPMDEGKNRKQQGYEQKRNAEFLHFALEPV